MTSRKSEFLTIDANIKKSGQGDCSPQGNTVRSFVTQPRGKKTIAKSSVFPGVSSSMVGTMGGVTDAMASPGGG